MKKFFPILLTIFIVSAFLLVEVPSPALADAVTPVPGDPLTGSGIAVLVGGLIGIGREYQYSHRY